MLGYRTVLNADYTDANREKILRVLKQWTTKRKRFPSLPVEGTVTNKDGAKLSATSFSIEGSSGMRWELVEEWDDPGWQSIVSTTGIAVTHITIIVSNGRLWLWVDIEPPTLTLVDRDGKQREEVQYTGTPGFVSELLAAVEMRDGRAEPMSGFQIIPSASYVDELVSVLEDETRLGAVFVTAPPQHVSVDSWKQQSDDRSYAMQGLGFGYVLSAEALREFNSRAALGHSVPSGGMRTFVPGADLSSAEDSFNHRLMHPSTLRDTDDRRIRRILRKAQIERLRTVRLPAALREADYEFLRKRRMQPFDVLHEGVATETAHAGDRPDAGAFAAEIEDLRRRLSEAEDLALEAMDDITRLKSERDEAIEEAELNRMEAEDSYLRYSERARQVDKLNARNEHLQRELASVGAAAAAWSHGEEHEESRPATFAELVQRLGDLNSDGTLPGVRFSGVRDDTIELDEHSGLGQAAVEKVWDALLTFSAYSTMRAESGFDQSLSHYVKDGSHGGYLSIGRIVWSEGEQVSNPGAFRRQRIFPVDKKVDPSGALFMPAHLRVSNLKGVAPRLYFEDTYSAVGYVTVGYIGSHLDNTLTS